jgi:CRP/FNR family transcriptional regulator, cyclic AMP receptor protein
MELLSALLSERDRVEVLRRSRARQFARNEVVFHEGDPGDALHIVESGLFVARSSSTLGHVLTINIFRPWSVFGELALLSPGACRSATVVAMRSGRTRSLRRDDLEELHVDGPGRIIDQFLLAVLAERNRALTAQVVELLFTPAAKRMQRQLLRLAELGVGEDDGWIRISQDELAMMTATTRATANRVLRDLEKREIVEIARGRIRIVDRAGLSDTSRD